MLDIWLNEDIGRGDLTNCIVIDKRVSAYWITKTAGVFCGASLVELLFKKLDQSTEVKILVSDGEHIKENQKILELHGAAKALLAGERISLNIAMHLSGISTSTSNLAKQLKGTGIHLADTRKTTPGLRQLEKYAFRCGGGINHRLGLDDAAMLKENHIAWSKDIKDSVQSLRKKIPWTSKIIVEAETPEQAKEAVIAGADGILLDEMHHSVLERLVPELRSLASTNSQNDSKKNIILEISGVDPMHLKQYANTGVDLISTSAPITKSPWLDFSMRFNENI